MTQQYKFRNKMLTGPRKTVGYKSGTLWSRSASVTEGLESLTNTSNFVTCKENKLTIQVSF